jgi:hypothetical protein
MAKYGGLPHSHGEQTACGQKIGENRVNFLRFGERTDIIKGKGQKQRNAGGGAFSAEGFLPAGYGCIHAVSGWLFCKILSFNLVLFHTGRYIISKRFFCCLALKP